MQGSVADPGIDIILTRCMANYYSTVSVRPGPNIDSGAVSERRIINVSVYANTPVYCYVNLNTGGRPATRIGRVNTITYYLPLNRAKIQIQG